MEIDLNADLGEGGGSDEALLDLVSSANIACGWHAGGANAMRDCVRLAIRKGVAIGAHPSFHDPGNFGRKEMNLPADDIYAGILYQLGALSAIAQAEGGRVAHVKPHGALYNQAVHNAEIAAAISEGVARWNRDVVLVGLADSPMLDVFRKCGFAVAAEAFADRLYEPNGTLRARKFDDALIRDPHGAGNQAVSIATANALIARGGKEISVHAQTLCIHGDTPGADKIAAAVSQALRAAGVALQPL
jgi:5-oxoprolinase (ATP-hydrolysing) subunit A